MMYTAMVVDDEYPARNMLDLLVDWEECEFKIVAKAENGRQALDFYRKERPDLVITDIQNLDETNFIEVSLYDVFLFQLIFKTSSPLPMS